MSKIQVNEIVNHFDTGAPDCPKGLTVTGFSTFTGGVSIGGTLTYEDVTNIDSVGVITARSGIDVGTGTSISSPSSNVLTLGTNNGERLRITSSGGVLIGGHTTAVDSGNAPNIEIVNTSTSTLTLARNDTSIASGNDIAAIRVWGNDSDGTYQQCAEILAEADGDHGTGDKPTALAFKVTADGASSPTERLRIDSAGNVNIGPSANANGHGLLTLSKSASEAFNALVIQQGNTAFTATDGLHIGIDAGVNAYFKLYENRDFIFYTGTSNTERVRIESSGRVGINTDTFNDASEALRVNAPTGQANTMLTIKSNNNGTGHSILNFGDDDFNEGRIIYDHSDNSMRFRTNDSERMRIDVDGKLFLENITGDAASGSTLKYNNSDKEVRYDTSSRLLKTNITECTYGIETIKKLKPSRYTPQEYDKEGNITVSNESCIGFIADEMLEDVPEVVQMYPKSTLTKNVEDTELVPAAISYDKLTPVLTKALQEAITKIETLETKVAELQGN